MAFQLRVNPLGKTIQNASRLRTIVGVFAKHGLYKLAEQVRLGQFLIERFSASAELEQRSVAERVRLAFEELGPTFVKLGQLLATRPDLVPEEYVVEFSKLHAQVLPLSFDVIEQVIQSELGTEGRAKFVSIEPVPLGSASIAQVHRAKLVSGEDVVLKVQRPGILQTINEDLGVLFFLAELLEKYVPETKLFSPVAIVEEYFKSLELETNFVVEANNIRRFQNNFAGDDQIKIPKVYLDLTSEKILVMEMMSGVPITDPEAFLQPDVDPHEIVKKGYKIYLKMVFIDGLFHGDLHAGNFFVIPQNKIGLIDFGMVGRLNPKTQSAIANMLFALAKEDYERLAYEYVDLAPFTDQVNVDLFAKELRELIAPYFGLTLKNVNMGKLLMTSASIAAKHRLKVPSELMMYFKSLVAIEGLGRTILKEFDFLQYSLEFASELVRMQLDPQKLAHELTQVARESKNLLHALPRQLHFLLRKINSPEHDFKFRLAGLTQLTKSFESSFKLLFLGIIISTLILSGSLMVAHPSGELVLGLPAISVLFYSIAAALGLIAFINYIRNP